MKRRHFLASALAALGVALAPAEILKIPAKAKRFLTTLRRGDRLTLEFSDAPHCDSLLTALVKVKPLSTTGMEYFIHARTAPNQTFFLASEDMVITDIVVAYGTPPTVGLTATLKINR